MPATAGGAPGEAPGPRRAANAKMPLVGQRRPALPRTDSAVPSALGGLTSGFGMGPGVPPPPWPLTNKGHSPVRGASRRALGAAQHASGDLGNGTAPTARAGIGGKSSAY